MRASEASSEPRRPTGIESAIDRRLQTLPRVWREVVNGTTTVSHSRLSRSFAPPCRRLSQLDRRINLKLEGRSLRVAGKRDPVDGHVGEVDHRERVRDRAVQGAGV